MLEEWTRRQMSGGFLGALFGALAPKPRPAPAAAPPAPVVPPVSPAAPPCAWPVCPQVTTVTYSTYLSGSGAAPTCQPTSPYAYPRIDQLAKEEHPKAPAQEENHPTSPSGAGPANPAEAPPSPPWAQPLP